MQILNFKSNFVYICYGSNGSSVYINNIYKIHFKYYITDSPYSIRWHKKKKGILELWVAILAMRIRTIIWVNFYLGENKYMN